MSGAPGGGQTPNKGMGWGQQALPQMNPLQQFAPSWATQQNPATAAPQAQQAPQQVPPNQYSSAVMPQAQQVPQQVPQQVLQQALPNQYSPVVMPPQGKPQGNAFLSELGIDRQAVMPQGQNINPGIDKQAVMPPGYSAPQWLQQIPGEFGMGKGIDALIQQLQQDPRFHQNPGMRPSLSNLGGSFSNARQQLLGNPNSLPVQRGPGGR